MTADKEIIDLDEREIKRSRRRLYYQRKKNIYHRPKKAVKVAAEAIG